MRKMKKINGFLVVRFNDREKRNNPTLGSFGVIDGSQYTGDLDFDLDAFEYTDADLIEIAVEQARGLDAEQDYSDEPPVYTVVTETAEEVKEEEVEPQFLINGWEAQLKGRIKSSSYKDVDPRTAAHELYGYKVALCDLGLLDREDRAVDPDHFAPGAVEHPFPRSFEALLAYVCDELCKFREGRTQEELDAICERCKLERWAQGTTPEPSPRYHLGKPRPIPQQEKAKETFTNLPDEFKNERVTRKVYALGLALGEDSPGNDCIIYRNIFNMARELDEALDAAKPNSAPFLALRSALINRVRELRELYLENYAVQQFKEGIGSGSSGKQTTPSGCTTRSELVEAMEAHLRAQKLSTPI